MFTDEKLPAMTKLVVNRTTLTPIRIWKRDYYTNVPLANVQVKIEVKDGTRQQLGQRRRVQRRRHQVDERRNHADEHRHHKLR